MRVCSTALAVSLIVGMTACHADLRREPYTDITAGAVDVLFTGDILLDRGVRRTIEQQGADALFTEGIDSFFHASQVVVALTAGESRDESVPQRERTWKE